MKFLQVAVFLFFVSTCSGKAPTGPWDAFNYSPTNKDVRPAAVHSTNGSVTGASGLVDNSAGNATLSGNGAYVVLDFGKEVSIFPSFALLSFAHDI